MSAEMKGRYRSSGISVFKIDDIEADESNALTSYITDDLSDLKFKIIIKQTNSKQLDSDIDLAIEKKLSIRSQILPDEEKVIKANGEKIGELDIVIKTTNDITYFIEIEKSNKKTLWFDYVKLLTVIKGSPNSFGIIICPKNYAHSVGVWNLYKEAVTYKAHLVRLFGPVAMERIFIVGYTQYAHLRGKWKPFTTSVIKEIKKNH